LFAALLKDNIAAVGTVRAQNFDSSIIPEDFESNPWGSVWAKSSQNILELAWLDNNIVKMMSTHHPSLEFVIKQRKKPRKGSNKLRKTALEKKKNKKAFGYARSATKLLLLPA
jgi:hypothetical protein